MAATAQLRAASTSATAASIMTVPLAPALSMLSSHICDCSMNSALRASSRGSTRMTDEVASLSMRPHWDFRITQDDLVSSDRTAAEECFGTVTRKDLNSDTARRTRSYDFESATIHKDIEDRVHYRLRRWLKAHSESPRESLRKMGWRITEPLVDARKETRAHEGR